MTPSDKLREIVCKYGRMLKESDETITREMMISNLTALISEDYTANEEVDKMVEEMRQKLFSMRASKETMDMLSEADRLITYGYHDCINEMLMWTKSKKI